MRLLDAGWLLRVGTHGQMQVPSGNCPRLPLMISSMALSMYCGTSVLSSSTHQSDSVDRPSTPPMAPCSIVLLCTSPWNCGSAVSETPSLFTSSRHLWCVAVSAWMTWLVWSGKCRRSGRRSSGTPARRSARSVS